MHELINTLPFLRLFCTKLHHYEAVFCEALRFFSLCPKESAKMLAKSLMMSCQHVIWQVGMTFFPNVGLTFLTCRQHDDMCQDDMSFGDLDNMTQCQHFQLSLDYKSLNPNKSKGAEGKCKMESIDSWIPMKPKKVEWTDKC